MKNLHIEVFYWYKILYPGSEGKRREFRGA